MLLNELSLGLLFYLVFTLFGAIGLPFLGRLFPNKTLAYVSSKILGLVIFGYIIWLLSSLKLLNYQNYIFIFSFFIIACALGIFLSKSFFTKEFFKKIIWVEVIAVVIYLLYLILRSYNSAINGTERFMDMALLSASGKTNFFPFIDPWYAGKTINYYYYGSYLVSLISNLSKLPYELTYNFALGLIFSQSTILSGMLIFAVSYSKKLAVLGAFLVTSAGSTFFGINTIKAVLSSVPNKIYSYTSSTRLFTPSYIINEIPSYSFTVGDLHAHLLALPFFLFNLILLYNLTSLKKPNMRIFLLLGLSLATSGMINAWDFITLSSVLLIFAVIKFRSDFKAHWFLYPIGTILFSLFLAWPALHSFQSPILGIGFIPTHIAKYSLTNVQYPTPISGLLGIWGTFTIGIIAIFTLKRKAIKDNLFVIALSIVSFGIIIGVELFFIKDIYGIANPPYFRANTTFKFGYHAWIMLSLIFSMILSIFHKKLFKTILVIAVVFGGIFYPYQAIKQFYLSNTQNEKTLNGVRWMNNSMPADWDIVNYINKNFHNRVVIAEAVGDSYTTYSRISTFTGMITPIGWKTHEWTWRFEGENAKNSKPGETVETGWGKVAKISQDIENLYSTNDIALTVEIIKKYDINFVYIGGLERSTYPALNENKFYELGKIEFQSNKSVLIALNKI